MSCNYVSVVQHTASICKTKILHAGHQSQPCKNQPEVDLLTHFRFAIK